MAYIVRYRRVAERELKALGPEMAKRINARIGLLRDDPHPAQSQRLKASPNFRLRIGNYRVVYAIDDVAETITIVAVGHRRDVYR